ncbi:hypothetical protein IVB45_17800 [Bradyrhizobium sp. 4]|uniref:phage tail fiber protein n=1 Tax=unclassified Bradyrhizobium TaxID=2631580 RepID=UPI001FFB48DF|nr:MULTISPECIES: hypothetical protein [unclassified Bradyrhizobium]MCK1401969.1 hypothetical protein [Bradyrhizobium sp. 39]MCK1751311.1 hypothetical protein [Bradyrhizobium sp. 135]UPJ38560.1 hypothetical protein IVB45_17800 [Bradyrhizobium sp. 4]
MIPYSAYLALGNFDASGLVFTELTIAGGAKGYARQSISLAPAGAGSLVNSAAIDFPVATKPFTWPSFRAYAVFDALTAGNQQMAWKLGNPIVVAAGDRHRLKAGDIELNFPVATSSLGSEVLLSQSFTISADKVLTGLPSVTLTQAAYDALATKDPMTLYVIVG